MKDVQHTIGRLTLVEPNNILENEETARQGRYSDFINYPYENYCMAVDLSVRLADRYSCGLSNQTGESKEFYYSTNNGTISFLGGSKISNGDSENDNFLTINYTDINLLNPDSNTRECLGIESISISYGSWMQPQVVIKFVDVRGGTVFNPAEKNYYTNNESSISSEIYKALFSFPYPIFTLKVKGFYGKGVTYKLYVSNTTSSFDANTGNFNITVTTVGYMFGIYADLPMTYLAIAPYIKNTGNDYWKEKIEGRTFYFEDINGNKVAPMMTLPELRLQIARAAMSGEVIEIKKKSETLLAESDSKIRQCNEILSKIPTNGGEWSLCSEDKDNYAYKFVYHEYDKEIYENKDNNAFSNGMQSFKTAIDTLDKSWSGFVETFLTYCSATTLPHIVKYEKNEDEWVYQKNQEENSAINIYDNDEYKKSISEECERNEKYFWAIILKVDPKNQLEKLKEAVNTKKNNFLNDRSELEEERKKIEAAAIEKALGFTPSIKNLYNLSFAHLDTFMHCFYECLKNIRHQLDKEKGKRAKNTYGIKDGDTDTEPSSNGARPDSTVYRGDYLPPFAAFYETSSEGKRVLKWAGSITNGNELEEVKLVKKLLSATGLYTKSSEETDKAIAEIKDEKDAQTTGNDIPNVSTTNFIPLTDYDFAHKDLGNPYSHLANIDNGSSRQDTIVDEIFGIFALRAYQYLLLNNTNPSVFPTLEAVNIYKAFGEKKSRAFDDFIKKMRDMEPKEFIDLITQQHPPKIWARKNSEGEVRYTGLFWGTKNLFSEGPLKHGVSRQLENTGGERVYLFPLRVDDFATVIKEEDTLYNEQVHNDKYLIIGKKSGETATSATSCHIFEEQEYISTIINNAKDEIKDFGIDKSITSAYEKYNKVKTITFYNEVEEQQSEEKETTEENTKSQTNILIPTGAYDSKNPYSYSAITLSDIYKKNKDNELAKAFLFLQSIRYKDTYKHDLVNYYNVVPKLWLLIEGSLYWREDETEEPIKIPDGYLLPEKHQLFRVSLEQGSPEGLYIISRTNTAHAEYINWREVSKDRTFSKNRRERVKQYFIEWVKENYKNIEKLENQNYYNNNNKELRTAGEGVEGIKNQLEEIQKFLKDLLLTRCTIIDYYKQSVDYTYSKSSIHRSQMRKVFREFKDAFNEIYDKKYKELKKEEEQIQYNPSDSVKVEDPFKNDDARLSVYMTLKSLYDKWICNGEHDGEEWKLGSGSKSHSHSENFMYIDTLFRNVGNQLTVNVTELSSWLSSCLPTSNTNSGEGLMTYNGQSLYNYLYSIATSTGGMLIPLPQTLGMKNAESVVNMFKPWPYYSNWDNDSQCFVYMYTYKPSEHLGDSSTSNFDMNGYSPTGDGVDLTDDDVCSQLFPYDGNEKVYAFAVTPAKGNQAMFKNVTLDSANAGLTDVAIMSTMQIAAKESDSPRETVLYGQDLYRIFSQYSFNCKVESMGNLQITPLMYFQLNNIPMWKGAYQIMKVSHEITAGNISTVFEGVRINKHCIPLVNPILTVNLGPKEIDGNKDKNTYGKSKPSNTTGTITSSVIEDTKPGATNPNNLPNISTLSKDITPAKPVICLIPGHGPKTWKKAEWEWNSKVIDDAIIPKLKKMNFSDGTSMENHIVRCNINGKNTGAGYSTREIQELIKKFGSDKVISVAVHWNGGGGNYHSVFVNHKKGVTVKDGKTSPGVREDAKKFAECMKASFEKITEELRKKEDSVYPKGMLDGYERIVNLDENNTDGGPRNNCACILTENWFADYAHKKEYKGLWANISRWMEKDEDGRYKSGRGWLWSEEGLDAVGEAHAQGIKNYLDMIANKT